MFIPVICLTLCGCMQTGRPIAAGASAAAGGFLGNKLSRGSAIGSAGGAAAGAFAAESAWEWKTRNERRAFDEGARRMMGDVAKSKFWQLERAHQPSEGVPRYRRLTITVPAHREGGVLYESQTQTILIAE
jgi:hypothetical protein